MQSDKITALYSRLSHEDGEGESNSISNQKSMLTDYAKRNYFPNIRHFIDDGWSGTRWDRPSFTELMSLVNEGKVGAINVKDMSRFGRDYLQVGIYTDIVFPDNDVRFIAIKDNVDSENRSQNNDFTAIVNLFNEFHARDTAKKVRDALAVRGKSGKYLCTNPPYGYLKDPQDKEKWSVDEQAAKVIRRIFDHCIAGKGASQIARILWKEKVLTPSAHMRNIGVNTRHKAPTDSCLWKDCTVEGILTRMEYLGYMVNFKHFKKNYKKKRSYRNDPENWVIFKMRIPRLLRKPNGSERRSFYSTNDGLQREVGLLYFPASPTARTTALSSIFAPVRVLLRIRTTMSVLNTKTALGFVRRTTSARKS